MSVDESVRLVKMSRTQRDLVAKAWAEGWPDHGDSEWLGDLAGAYESALPMDDLRQRIIQLIAGYECDHAFSRCTCDVAADEILGVLKVARP